MIAKPPGKYPKMGREQDLRYPIYTRIYLAGPMTGLPGRNYLAFYATASHLRSGYGFVVYNPAENFGGRTELRREDYMRVDIGHLLQAQMVVVLPEWDISRGASLEVAIARELNLPVCTFSPDQGLREIPNE